MANTIQTLRSSTAAARPAGRALGELFVNMADKVFGYIDAAGNPVDIASGPFPPPFDAATAYVVGDRVTYSGRILQANAAIAAGAFSETDWDILVGGSTVTYAAAAPTAPMTADMWYRTTAPTGISIWDGATWTPVTGNEILMEAP